MSGGGTSGGGAITGRPVPGQPRPYDFPHTERTSLANGLRVIVTPMPGRALVAASLTIRAGAVDEPDPVGGATVLAARALTEGTELRDAIQLTEATERLGASLHAEAGWDATSIGLDVPATRLAPALDLLAEVLRRPAFPPPEVERLRDERLTDLLQAKADPRRRADEAYVSSIYAPSSPYRRPAGGTAETVGSLGEAELRAIHAREYKPDRAALVVAGDVDPDEILRPVHPPRAAGSTTRAPSTAGSCGWSTGRAPSRPRSGSATRGWRGVTRTSTRCRS
jgi:zinc protease